LRLGEAIAAYDWYEADALVVEINNVGAMVEAVFACGARWPALAAGAREPRKTTRAEPMAALYEQGRVSHAGAFPTLEEQMVLFMPFGTRGRRRGR
jgi:phage terminase large subunit-like protein